MDHRTNENFLVSEQKVVFDRSWKQKLLSAHSEFRVFNIYNENDINMNNLQP